ncbi:adenylate kinase [soil metagenome]
MIIIFTGPPFAGKDTQAKIISEKMGLPVFSMGQLIREAYKAGNPKAVEGFEQYSMKGLHLPTGLKFDLLQEKIEKTGSGYILDNFPGTQEDLDTYLAYLQEKNQHVDCVIYIHISPEEMLKRMKSRGRADDTPEIVLKRRDVQDKDREKIIAYFTAKGILEEIDGEGDIESIDKQIIERIHKYDPHKN